MQRDLMAKLALGCAGVMMCGSLAGMGLANYVATGAFDFYRQPNVAQWREDRQSTGYEIAAASFLPDPTSTTAGYLAPYASEGGSEAAMPAYVAYEP